MSLKKLFSISTEALMKKYGNPTLGHQGTRVTMDSGYPRSEFGPRCKHYGCFVSLEIRVPNGIPSKETSTAIYGTTIVDK